MILRPMFKQGLVTSIPKLFSFVVRFFNVKILIFLKHYIRVHISFISDQIFDIATPSFAPHLNLPLFQ